MGHGTFNSNSDFRLRDCKHKRLREALEFRPASSSRVAPSVAPALVLLPVAAPAPSTGLELELERTTPTGFLAGAVSTLTLALIWFVLTCVTDMSC